MSRNLLHKSKLEPFKEWLTTQGLPHRPPRGDYDVLQVLVLHKEALLWMCVFDRHTAPEHYTVDSRMEPLVRRFIKEQKATA